MIRIFVRCNTATDGAHWHLACTGHRWVDTLRTLRRRYPLSSAAGRDLWFDRGVCDGTMRLLADSRGAL